MAEGLVIAARIKSPDDAYGDSGVSALSDPTWQRLGIARYWHQ